MKLNFYPFNWRQRAEARAQAEVARIAALPPAPCGNQAEHYYWEEQGMLPCPICRGRATRKRRDADKDAELNLLADKIAVKLSPANAEPQGCALFELQQIAKRGPHITPDDVRDIAAMPRDELQRRALRSRDWHGHFAHSLDGIPAIRNMPGAAPDGCWSHKEVRAVVEGLLAKLASQQGEKP